MGLAKDAEDTLGCVTNQNISIFNKIQEPVRSSVLYEKRILKHSGYVTRREVGNLGKDILLGKSHGKRGRGRSPTRWSDIIKARMDSMLRVASQARNRNGWRALLGAIRS